MSDELKDKLLAVVTTGNPFLDETIRASAIRITELEDELAEAREEAEQSHRINRANASTYHAAQTELAAAQATIAEVGRIAGRMTQDRDDSVNCLGEVREFLFVENRDLAAYDRAIREAKAEALDDFAKWADGFFPDPHAPEETCYECAMLRVVKGELADRAKAIREGGDSE